MPFAHLPDAKIHYELSGPEHLPVLVFSNSLGTNLRMWHPQIQPFSQHFRILRYDTRGHGYSSVTPGPYSIEQLSADVLRLLDSLHLHRFFFCGLSMGGSTGMFLGANAATRLSKVVLCNTAPKIGTTDPWNTRIQAVQSGGMDAVANSVIERWFTPNFRAHHPAETRAVLSMLESTDPLGYVANCAAVRDADQRGTLKNIRVPCLVVSGLYDLSTPAPDVCALAQAIPGAQYVELPASHLSNIEASELFNRHVLQFLLS